MVDYWVRYGEVCAEPAGVYWYVDEANNPAVEASDEDLACYLPPSPFLPHSPSPPGFYQGVMLVGKYAGQKVFEAKPRVRADMLAEGLLVQYWEPESLVMSRSVSELW